MTDVGRWSAMEHALFVEAMELWPKQWQKIGEVVTTRTLVQIRTHAQKCWTDSPPGAAVSVAPTGPVPAVLSSKKRKAVDKNAAGSGVGATTAKKQVNDGELVVVAVAAPAEPAGGSRWTKEEDAMLRAGVTAIGAMNWKSISDNYLGGCRTDVQCLHRWNKVLMPGLVKGPWSTEEDEKIKQCIATGKVHARSFHRLLNRLALLEQSAANRARTAHCHIMMIAHRHHQVVSDRPPRSWSNRQAVQRAMVQSPGPHHQEGQLGRRGGCDPGGGTDRPRQPLVRDHQAPPRPLRKRGKEPLELSHAPPVARHSGGR